MLEKSIPCTLLDRFLYRSVRQRNSGCQYVSVRENWTTTCSSCQPYSNLPSHLTNCKDWLATWKYSIYTSFRKFFAFPVSYCFCREQTKILSVSTYVHEVGIWLLRSSKYTKTLHTYSILRTTTKGRGIWLIDPRSSQSFIDGDE